MQLNTVVQQNASGAEEIAATCEELASQSIEMQSVMDLLKYGKYIKTGSAISSNPWLSPGENYIHSGQPERE